MQKRATLPVNTYILLALLASSVIILHIPLTENAISIEKVEGDIPISPSFSNQEILDFDFDWIYMKNNSHTRYGDYSTNIESVDYNSNGKTLDAILWLYFPFQVNQSRLNEEVNYGMYIDADFNPRTGYGGVDYKFELSWNSQSKKWTKVLEKWSHFGETLILDNKTIPYTDFSKRDAHYVILSADLDSMLYPKKYKVVFYGEAKRNGELITDFTRMIAVPPLELAVSSSPNSVELRKGETKIIEVKVNTTQGYEPIINLNTTSQSKYLISDFTQNDTSPDRNYTLRIPSYGIATTPLTITSTGDAPIGPYTLFVFANSSFPPEQFIESKSTQESRARSGLLPASALTSENIFTQYSLLVTVREPLTLIDQVGDLWDKVGQPISFVTGIIIGYIGPWIYTKIKKRSKNQRS